MKPLTREEILLSFSKKERKEIKFPDLESIDWDNLDFLGWIHPSGHLGYVVYELPTRLRGIILERNSGIASTGIRMCSWCLTLHFSSGVKLFTYKIPNSNITIGDYICADLQCSLYLRGIKKTGISPMQETLSIEEKIERCRRNIEKFFLFIDEKINK